MFRPVRRILSRAPLSYPLPAMNLRLPLLSAAVLSILSLAPAQAETIAPGATYSQNFNGIGTSATATLPSGWKVSKATTIQSVTQALYEGAASVTEKTGTGSGNSNPANGIYNWVNAGDSSDHSVGFIASGTATKTGNLYLVLTASGSIPDFTISYDMKCFRNNTRPFQFQLYYSTDAGATWTSAGSSFCTTYATSSSGGVVNPAGVTSVSSQLLNVSLSSGGTIVFCWSYSVLSGDTTNAQGLGIDNVVIVAGQNQSGLTPLPSPGPLSAANENYTGFILSWNSVSGATGYNVAVLNANSATTFSTQCAASDTSVPVTGLTPGGTYTAYVTALGDGTTHDDSEPASLSNIQTTAPTVLDTPTGLASSNVGYFGFTLSWTAVSDANGYTVTLSPAAGSVEVSGRAATVTGLAEGETYTASVVAKGNGTTTIDSPAATLDVTTATAPAVSAPALSTSNVSSSSLTVSWPEQTAAASYSVRAWYFDFVDKFTEMFPDWFNNVKTLPSGWTRSGTALGRYATEASPIQFDASNQTLTSPVFPGSLTSLSFRLRQYSGNENNASTFAVYGSSGEDGAEWNLLRAIDLYSEVSSDSSGTDFSLSVPTDVHQFRFAYTKGAGNCGFGTFTVYGTDVCEVPFYLQGYGPTATSTSSTSVTLTPVAGEKNYVEVTAVGQTGKTASATIEVPVPAASSTKPAVIAVK